MRKKAEQKIIKPTRKCVVGVILALVMITVSWLIMFFANVMATKEFTDLFYAISGVQIGNAVFQYEGISSTGYDIAMNIEEAVNSYRNQLQTMADLSARATYDMVNSLGDRSLSKVGDGAIVKIEDGEVTISDGVRTGIRNYAAQITDARGILDYNTPTQSGVRRDLMVYSRIRGPYYYVEIINGTDMLYYIDKYVNYDEVLAGIESAYGVELFMICPDRENSRYFYNVRGDLIYYPGKWAIDDPVNTDSTSVYGLPSNKEEILALNGRVSVDANLNAQEAHSYVVLEVDQLDSILLISVNNNDIFNKPLEQTSVGFLVILILTITFIIWITSVYREMTTGNLTEAKKEKYSPGRMKLIALSYGILSTILVFLLSVFFRSLSNIYTEITDAQNTLGVMDVEIDSNGDFLKQRADARRALYLEYAERAAQLIDKNPELNNKEDLSALNRIIGSEYIMLFDAEGKQSGTSSDYINMELGDDTADNPTSTADFRRILKGVYGIAHNAVKDEVTGRTLELYGTRTNDAQTGGYGVLILAVQPEGEASEANESMASVNSILRSLTPVGKVSFLAERERGFIEYSSSEDLLYEYNFASEMGMGESALRDGVADYFRIGATKHFCVSKEMQNKNILFLCTPNEYIVGNGVEYGLICGIGFAIVFFFLCLYLLHGYSNKMIEAVEERNLKAEEERKKQLAEEEKDNQPAEEEDSVQPAEDANKDLQAGEGNKNQKTKKKKKKSYNADNINTHLGTMIKTLLGNFTPERKATLAFETMLGLIFINLFLSMRSRTASSGQLVLNYVLTGKWNKGFNIFALTSIFLLLLGLILGMMFIRFVFRTLGKMLNSRGQTICRLIANLINYLAIMVFIYYSLSYLGVDTNAILASVGVIGIGVSMGARDLIADIFAGVSMIFEGNYQVGDIVNIDGYRGMVQEVGVRSTRLVGRGGNVKVIGNKDIKSVTNLTKMNSWVAVTIKVDVNYPIRDAEEIVTNALPKIGEKCHEIISGPYYKGILSVEMGFAVLSIIAECNEDNYHKVERTLVREVLLALREKNVPVR